MLVFLSLYVMLSIFLSILVCAAASLFCACLVSVHVSAPYVIAGRTGVEHHVMSLRAIGVRDGGQGGPIRAVRRHEFWQRVDIIRAKHNTCLNNTN